MNHKRMSASHLYIIPALGLIFGVASFGDLNSMVAGETERPGPGPGPRLVDPCFQQVSEDGFGSRNNRYAWAMKTFGDHLYVGTLNLTLGFGLPSDQVPSPDLISDEFITEGTEIWRYDGSSWEQVVDAGLTTKGNVGVRNLASYDGQLYAGTVNALGAEVWRTSDGVNWEVANESGFGNPFNASIRGMTPFDGKLYVGTGNDQTGAEIWATDGESWEKVVTSADLGEDFSMFSALTAFNGALYAGTWRSAAGCMLFKFDGQSWQELVGPNGPTSAGFGDPTTEGIHNMVEFNGSLFVGTVNFNSGFALMRSDDEGSSWEQVGEYGFGDPQDKYAWRLHVHQGELYLGTYTQGTDQDGPMQSRQGAKLYRSPDGIEWVQEVGPDGTLSVPGFADTNYGFRTLESFQGDLYIGTAQCFYCIAPVTGTEIWRRDSETCGE